MKFLSVYPSICRRIFASPPHISAFQRSARKSNREREGRKRVRKRKRRYENILLRTINLTQKRLMTAKKGGKREGIE
jgi:hypothetical protein